MQLAFELSGEHETLPKAEVFACLRTLNVAYEERIFSDRILVIDAQLSPERELLDVLAKRLGMTHHIYEVKGKCVPAEKELLEIVNTADLEAVMGEEDTFAVRLRGEHKNSFSVKRNELPMIVGERITSKGYKVSLKNPSKTFVLLLTAQTCFFCVLLHSVKKKQFEATKPRFRPFFLPGVIMPKVARVLVNLSGLNAKELFLDPFCGTGGILIEAGMVGARIIGSDVQERMVRGARENLHFFGLPGDCVVGDAAQLPLGDNTVDAVATDMPYGRSSFVSTSRYKNAESHAAFLERLYQHALDEIHRLLKPERKAVIVSSSPPSHYFYPKHDFQLLETHVYRVHKSLNRYITVLKKE
ncbi:MAG: methyltransferase domain-containing protein [Methanophagales archaeon]|nr:methyltransferase domain-containing protein [Methanophagales archaeon]